MEIGPCCNKFVKTGIDKDSVAIGAIANMMAQEKSRSKATTQRTRNTYAKKTN